MTSRPRPRPPHDAALEPLAALAPLLSCLACGGAGAGLVLRADGFSCPTCKARYPIYRSGRAAIPWLFRDPEAAHLEWRSRFSAFLQEQGVQIERLQRTLGRKCSSQRAAERLARLAAAREAHKKEILELLAPLALAGPRAAPKLDRAGALHGTLPKQHALTSYYANVFRDWSWDNGENDQLFECVGRVLQELTPFTPGRVLTLGAGAGRLTYDFHRHYRPAASIALDLNPLLILLASRVVAGERVAAHEFPVAPLDLASLALRRECAAPEPVSGITFVLADAMDPPFKPAAFDTVLTPWLVDVVPQDLGTCAQVVNRLLAVGGIWINTGSLAFFHREESWCYSADEVPELLAAHGFALIAAERNRIAYLQSPASAHGRIESVYSFSARKITDAAAPERAKHLPAWCLQTGRSVPDSDEFVVAAADHLLKAQVLAAIDGRRSIEQIAALIARHYGLHKAEASAAVRRIVVDLCEAALVTDGGAGRHLE